MVKMSRIGNQPILIPLGVTVKKDAGLVAVAGPKGKLELLLHPSIDIEMAGQNLLVKPKLKQKNTKAVHGLMRNLLNNMVIGVTEGWSKNLELVGVGFRAQVFGDKLILDVGYSHPVEIKAQDGITFAVTDNNKIRVSGIDKQLVGQISANLKKVRPPDVYKGKGIRFEGEYIRKKVGKSAKVGAAGAGTAGGK